MESSTSPPREWTKTSPTIYERTFDEFEKFFLFIAGNGQGRRDRQNWLPTTGIKLSTERVNFVEEVKAAWKALRYDHPGYAALIQDGRWIYTVADEAELVSWMEETFVVHDGSKTASQLFPFEESSRRVVLHVLPHTQELALQAPHTHVDGIGMITFFDHLLRHIVNPSPTSPPAWGTEASNLTPMLSFTAHIPTMSPTQKALWDTNLQAYLSAFPTVRLHNENKGTPATKTTMQYLRFTRAETASIVTRCKQLGFSVTAAAQAAISHAARIHGQTLDQRTHATLAIYDARGYIDPAEFPHHKLVGPHTFAMPTVFPIEDSFVATARRAYEIFRRYKTQGDMLRACSPLWGSEIPAIMGAPLPAEMPVMADLQLSSLGVMDKYLKPVYEGQRGKIEVQDLWITLEMLSPNIAVEMWTFDGRLTIMPIYNQRFHRRESVTALCALVQEQLRQGLGVDLGFDVRVPGEEVGGWEGGKEEAGGLREAEEAEKRGLKDGETRLVDDRAPAEVLLKQVNALVE